jgi:hypothetical protein
MNKKMATKKQKEHYDKLARFGCVLCFWLGFEGSPAEIHHIRRTRPRKDSPAIPLCPEHHRGDTGIHGLGRKRFESEYDITEEELLKIANDAIDYKWEKVDEDTFMGSRIQ